jgi:hypothetical protein
MRLFKALALIIKTKTIKMKHYKDLEVIDFSKFEAVRGAYEDLKCIYPLTEKKLMRASMNSREALG